MGPCFNRRMALIDKLKESVTGVVKVAWSAGQQVQSTAAPVVKQTVQALRSQVDQRLGGSTAPQPEPPAPPAPPNTSAAPVADDPAEAPPAAPTPKAVAKNISPKPEQAATVAPRKPPAKKSAPGAKLPPRRAPNKPDSA